MSLKFYKTFEHDGVADGTSVSNSWEAEEDYKIKRIYIRRKDGYALHKSTFYFKIHERVYTRELVPAGILAEDALISPVLDIPFNKAEKLEYTFKNLEGASIDIFVVIEVEPA